MVCLFARSAPIRMLMSQCPVGRLCNEEQAEDKFLPCNEPMELQFDENAVPNLLRIASAALGFALTQNQQGGFFLRETHSRAYRIPIPKLGIGNENLE